MDRKKILYISLIAAFVVTVFAGAALAADDGPLFTRNLSRTPETMTGASAMSTMWLYVPAQDTQGEPPDTASGELEYYAGDCTNQDTENCTLVYTRSEAKPLIATYNDGIHPEEIMTDAGIMTGAGFGERDAFAALSLDDGATWKNYNLSDSAARSSFVLGNGHEYPGDVFKMVHQVEGNIVVAAWISRYCESGAPLYSWTDEVKAELLTYYPELDHVIPVDGGTDDDGYQLYLDDMFTVGGSQKSVDYSLQGFPDVGEIPYGCVWVARGTLEQDLDENGAPLFNTVGDPVYDIVWRASERLTSGRRDPHQINITSSPGAGFIIEWQEDPQGLRPGKGLGSGEGWSGAIANSKTDFWYTYIDLAHVSDVCLDAPVDAYCTPGTLADFNATELSDQKPKAAVPFAMPVRITDNNACKGVQRTDTNGDLMDPYCYADFNENGTADFCADTVSWTNPGGTTLEVCVTEDGRTLTGRTASTRVRWAMKSYDSDGDGVPDSAWVAMGGEKMKALGTVSDSGTCDPREDPDCMVYDIGKNMHYYTFEFDKPALVTQGLMLNSYALSPEDGLPFDTYIDEWGYEIYDTEIARRVNLMVNSPAAAMASDSKLMGLLLYKQGILFQGGPADIFTRRIVLPDDFDPAVDNPFAYENVECVALDDAGVATPVDRLYPDGVNPNYVLGLCPVDGMNVSGTTLVRCSDESSGEACADQFPYDSTYEEWFVDDTFTELPKVLEWSQSIDNLNDTSWENPYDVSKGHRGFVDGDFVMMMYATAENWKANTTGNEAYQLYIRRSFDGGLTWTTMPANFDHINGITYNGEGATSCEWFGGYGEDDYSVCTDYAAGEFEAARNVSQLAGTRVTVLDPRYSPSGGMLKRDYKSLVCDDNLDGIWENCGYTDDASSPYPEDVRDPSAFFATFETGDNTVVTEETGTIPMDMYYSRASNFGDQWDEQDICALADTEESWYPSASVVCEEGVVELRWDWLENGPDWATEASVYGNPNGDRFYAVWNQELPVDVDAEIFTDMDTEFRRIFFNLGDDGVDTAPTAAIVYVSSKVLRPEENELVLIGSAWDNDHIDGMPYEDIAEVEWTITHDGVTTVIDDGDDNPKQLNLPRGNLHPGWQQFGFKAKDKGGRWSPGATVDILVLGENVIYIPQVNR